jgi:hypothetical protein
MFVHLRRPAHLALRELVVRHRRQPRRQNLGNLPQLQNPLRRQLRPQNLLRRQLLLRNLLRRQLRPQNQGQRLDRCHRLRQSQRVVGAPQSRSRRLLLLRADATECLLTLLASKCFPTHSAGGAVITNPSRPHCMSELNQLHSLFQRAEAIASF